MGLEVYFDMMSQPSRSVLMFCEVNNIPYEKKVTSVFAGDTRKEAYQAINPVMRVPAIKDGQFTLSESAAILKYLAAKYNTADHWYPSDVQKRAKVDQYIAWHHMNTREHSIKAFWTEVVIPRMRGTDVDQAKLEHQLGVLAETLKRLEHVYLKDQQFLCGDDITIADVLAVPEIMQLAATGRNITENQPKLTAWIERVKSRLQPSFDEFHTPIYKMRQKRLKAAGAKL
ncbi:glutathione S-transferase theta-1-like [Glandiceps talaboti]